MFEMIEELRPRKIIILRVGFTIGKEKMCSKLAVIEELREEFR